MPSKRTPAPEENATTPATDHHDYAAIDARVRSVLARSGHLLGPSTRDLIRPLVERHLSLADELRAIPLDTADEPDSTFTPFRSDAN